MQTSHSETRKVMANEALMQVAPSIFASRPMEDVSDKYTFIPTSEILGAMRDAGWDPVYAREQKVIRSDRQGFQPHIIRFHHREVSYANFAPKVGDARLELTMVNSHDRTKRYRLYGGVFRLVCTNGLVVPSFIMAEMEITHLNLSTKFVVEQSMRAVKDAGKIAESIDAMEQRTLVEEERLRLARACLTMRYSPLAPPITAEQLLIPRREVDQGTSLWQTFNVIQENIIRGGVRGESVIPMREGPPLIRNTVTQPITNIDREIKMNQKLWSLAEGLLKGGDIEAMALAE